MPHTPQTAFVRLLQSVTDARNIVPGDRIRVQPNAVILGPRDGLAALKAFRLAGGDKVVEPGRFHLFTEDHLPAPDEPAANRRKQLYEAARQAGLTIRAGAGCELALVREEAIVVPGELAVSNLPEIAQLGGIGAGALRVTVRDIAAMMAGRALELTVPETVRLHLTGQHQDLISGRDLFWTLRRELDRNHLVGRVLEIGGESLRSMTLRERTALSAQAGHAGLVACFCVPDREGVQELNKRIARHYETVEPEKGAGYAHQAVVDVGHAQLSLVPAGGAEHGCTIGEAAGEPARHVVLGGRSSLGIEDIRSAGEIIKQRRLAPDVRCDLVPGTPAVYAQAVAEDWIGHLLDAGVNVHPAGTSPDHLATKGALVTTVDAPPGTRRAGVIVAATAACVGSLIHPERLDAQPQRDSKLSGRQRRV